MNHASLFSGIGGFDLAAEWMGWNNILSCEIDPFCNKVLKHHFPNALQFGDIKQLKFKRDESGQLWVMADANERRYIATKPVTGSVERINGESFTKSKGRQKTNCDAEQKTHWLTIPSIDIITGGFPCQPFSMAGKRKGTDDDRHLWPEMLRAIREIQPRWIVGENVFGFTNWSNGMVFEQVLSDLENEGFEAQPFILPACAVDAPHRRDRVWIVAHSKEDRRSGEFKQWQNYSLQERGLYEYKTEGWNDIRTEFERFRENGDAADTDISKRLKRRLHPDGGKTERHISTFSSRNYERPTWDNFPTQSQLRVRNDGLSAGLDGITVSKLRNESIKAAGNAIVPQVAFQIFQAINEYERFFNKD